MNLLTLIGVIVKCSPKFVKNWLEKIVFIEPLERLPPANDSLHPNFIFVMGGGNGRPEQALRLWQTGNYSKIIASGGIGNYSQDRETPEAVLTYQYLVEHGVPETSIYIEKCSTTSIENIFLSFPLLSAYAGIVEALPITIVTNHHHIRRSIVLFKKLIKDYLHERPNLSKLCFYWSSAPDPEVNRALWQTNLNGCAVVGKEAIRLLQLRHARID